MARYSWLHFKLLLIRDSRSSRLRLWHTKCSYKPESLDATQTKSSEENNNSLMKRTTKNLARIAAALIAGISLVTWSSIAQNQTQQSQTPNQQTQNPNQSQDQLDQQRSQADQRARPEVEQERHAAEQQARQSLDKDAVAAIEELTKALQAISQNNTNEALAALERATGKLNILLARNPTNAFIPVSYEVEIVDVAPRDSAAVRARANAAEEAVEDKAFPTARVLLEGLASEIRTRIYNLPLISYPTAITEAARLLDGKRNQEASAVLLTALHTLVMVDRVTPLPIVLAKTAVDHAQSARDRDKNAAQRYLELARFELDRAKALGYAGNDPEYAQLNRSISNLEKQIKGNGNTDSLFANLKERLTAFFRRESQAERRSVGGTGSGSRAQQGQAGQNQSNLRATQPQSTQTQTNSRSAQPQNTQSNTNR